MTVDSQSRLWYDSKVPSDVSQQQVHFTALIGNAAIIWTCGIRQCSQHAWLLDVNDSVWGCAQFQLIWFVFTLIKQKSSDLKTQRRKRLDVTNWCRWDSDAPLWLFKICHWLSQKQQYWQVNWTVSVFFYYCCFWLLVWWFTGFRITMEPSTEVKKFKNSIFLCNELHMKQGKTPKKEMQHSRCKVGTVLFCSGGLHLAG